MILKTYPRSDYSKYHQKAKPTPTWDARVKNYKLNMYVANMYIYYMPVCVIKGVSRYLCNKTTYLISIYYL